MKTIELTLSLIAGFGLIFCSCSTGKSKEQTSDIPKTIELVVEPGENWFSKMRIFLFITKRNSPQLAAWIEDDNGNITRELDSLTTALNIVKNVSITVK
jgi:hypothetical protein